MVRSFRVRRGLSAICHNSVFAQALITSPQAIGNRVPDSSPRKVSIAAEAVRQQSSKRLARGQKQEVKR